MFAKPNNGRVLLKLGLVLVVLAGIAVAVFSGLQRTARVKLVKRDTAVDAVTGSVSVDADGGSVKELKSESDGKVVDCEKMIVGMRFKKNDVLVQLDTADLERAVKETKRKFLDDKLRAHIVLTNGKPELLANVEKISDRERAALFRKVSPMRKLMAEKLEHQRRLHKLGSISNEDLRSAERALEALDLELELKAFDERKSEEDFRAALDNLNLQIERMQIRAPSDGEITEAFIWAGALIGRGTIVGKFMSHDRVVAAKISEEDFGRVRPNQRARVRLLTYGEQEFDATVSRLLPKADDAQRFTVFLEVKVGSQDQLKPGSTGEATITVAQRPDAMMIPRRALFDSDKVYVVKDGRVQLRQVKVGYLNLTVAEILEGLSVDEAVIADQIDQFREGDRVRVELLP